jgi:hypothetical protein
MDEKAARALLGVSPDASPGAIRTAYHRAVRRHHPDMVGASADATRRTAEINRAYVLAAAAVAEPVSGPPGSYIDRAASDDRTPADAAPFDGMLTVTPGTADVFQALRDAADAIGTLGFVDRSEGIIETLVTPTDGPTCSLLLALDEQGGETVVQCTLEPLEGRPGPPIEAVIASLNAALDRRGRS